MRERTEIPYDQAACELFIACLRYIVDTCAAQGALMGVEYEIGYREMIAKVITTAPGDGSGPTLSADQLAQAAAMRRAAQQNATEAPPVWTAER